MSGAFLLLAGLAAVQADSAVGSVEGTVYGTGGAARSTLAYASVQLSVGPWHQTVDTDADGHYRFERVGAGPHFLTATRPGYDTARVEVIVPDGRTVHVDVTLHERPIVLGGVKVTVDGQGTSLPFDSVRPRGGREGGPLDRMPGTLGTGIAESGIADWAAATLGNPTRDPGDVLYMRGSASDLKLVLLDGAAVYTPFHVGGLLPSFDASLLESGALHIGAAPVRYDGGLSYIMDLRVREPRSPRWQGRASVDLVSAGAAFEGPLGERAGAVVATRGLHPFVNRFLGEDASPYGYGDGLARIDLRPFDGHSISVTGFANQESVALDFSEPTRILYGSRLPSSARWGNAALSIGYAGTSSLGDLRGRAAVSRYSAELPFAAEVPSFLQGLTHNAKFATQLDIPLDQGALRVGGDLDILSVDYRATEVGTSLSERTRSRAVSSSGALYAEWDRPIGTDVRVRGGARLSAFPHGDLRFAPRLGVTWLFSEAAALTLAAGQYHQLTSFTDDRVESALGLAQPSDVTFESVVRASTDRHLLGVAGATHFLVSLDQILPGQARLGVEGFYKRFRDLGRVGESLNASGVDLRLQKGGDRLSGWLGYSLNWFWTDNVSETDPFSGRHLLSAGLLGRLGRGDVDLRISYGDGLPFTTVPLGGEANALDQAGPGLEVASSSFELATTTAQGDPPLTGGPSGEFFRVDAEISTEFAVPVGERRTAFRPYLKILNALDRRDALFFYFEPWRDGGARPLAELSLLPVLGVEWTF